MAFFKISDDPDTNWKDIQIHGRKYIANLKIPMLIGTDAAQTYEDGIKIASVAIPTNKKLRIVKVNWSTQVWDTITETTTMKMIADRFPLNYNSFSTIVMSADDENSFTNTVADAESWLSRQSEKFYLRTPHEHYALNYNTLYFNSEIFNTNKLSYLNVYTHFGFPKGLVYADVNTALLSHYKLYVDASATAAIRSNFIAYVHIEMDILPDKKVIPANIKLRKL